MSAVGNGDVGLWPHPAWCAPEVDQVAGDVDINHRGRSLWSRVLMQNTDSASTRFDLRFSRYDVRTDGVVFQGETVIELGVIRNTATSDVWGAGRHDGPLEDGWVRDVLSGHCLELADAAALAAQLLEMVAAADPGGRVVFPQDGGGHRG